MSDELDPRVARTREVVITATVELLAELGFERITIDAIAERSGVARSTIYRNWPDRSALLGGAFRRLCARGPADVEASASLRDDLDTLGRMLVGQLTSETWSTTVPSLIGAAVHDPTMAALMAGFAQERQVQARAIFDRAVERGEIPERDAGHLDSALERFVAPFFFRRFMSHAPLDDAFVTAQVDATLAQLST
jgi:AcrR family transcriptional regulator